MTRKDSGLKAAVYPIPGDIDQSIAELKLASMGIKFDTLTKEQVAYLNSWNLQGAFFNASSPPPGP